MSLYWVIPCLIGTKHFRESKTLPRIQKHFPESKTLPRIQKHFPCRIQECFGFWEVFCPYEPSWSKLESFLLILDHIIFRKLLKINAERGTGNEYGMKEKTKNGRKNKELETKLPVGLGFNLGFCIQVFIFPVSRACSPHPRRWGAGK